LEKVLGNELGEELLLNTSAPWNLFEKAATALLKCRKLVITNEHLNILKVVDIVIWLYSPLNRFSGGRILKLYYLNIAFVNELKDALVEVILINFNL